MGSQSIAFEDSSSIYLFRTKKKSNMKIIISLGDYMKSKISFSKEGRTLLHHVAANKDQSKVYKNLMGMTEEKNPKDAKGWTPLHLAAEKGDLEMYKLIASKAEDKNPKAGKEADLWTPLHCAAKNGHFQIVEFICTSSRRSIQRMRKARPRIILLNLMVGR